MKRLIRILAVKIHNNRTWNENAFSFRTFSLLMVNLMLDFNENVNSTENAQSMCSRNVYIIKAKFKPTKILLTTNKRRHLWTQCSNVQLKQLLSSRFHEIYQHFYVNVMNVFCISHWPFIQGTHVLNFWACCIYAMMHLSVIRIN